MLFKGAGFPCKSPERAGGADRKWVVASFSGVGGEESPRIAVFGKNRDAITTLWFLSELMMEEICGRREGRKQRRDGAEEE